MPPRKRARVSRATSPDPVSQVPSPTPAAPTDISPTKDEQLLNDPWTDEEEIGLFKGLMRWKPTGIHKHFHLLALHHWLQENNYIHPRNPHTRPAGLWTKLHALYDLAALDAREDARQLSRVENPLLHEGRRAGAETRSSDVEDEGDEDAETARGKGKGDDENADEDEDDADAYSEAANKIDGADFALPGDAGFEEMMWRQRFARSRKGNGDDDDGEEEEEEDDDDDDKADGRESPPLLPELNWAEEPPVGFTPSFSIEPSDAMPPSGRAGKGRPVGAKGKGAKATVAPPAPSRRSARKAEHTVEENEEPEKGKDEDAEDDEDEDEEGEDEDNENEEGEREESQAGTPIPRSTRSTAESKRRNAAPTRSTRRTRR